MACAKGERQHIPPESNIALLAPFPPAFVVGPSFALPSFRKFSGHHCEIRCEVVGDSGFYVLTLVAGQGACLCLGLLSVCCCRRPWGAWSRLRPGVASAVLLVLVRANLGSKGESLGLLAQAAFAIGFLDTSWDFNRCEVQTQN